MARFTKLAVCFTLFITSVGCASLEPGFETPTVGITSFRVLLQKELSLNSKLVCISSTRTVLLLSSMALSTLSPLKDTKF